MRNLKRGRRGLSYKKRVADINSIYDRYAKLGISNREIWRRYIYPHYAISERQLYNILNASADPATRSLSMMSFSCSLTNPKSK